MSIDAMTQEQVSIAEAALPVKIVADEAPKEQLEAAHYGVWTQFSLAGTENALQILGYDRYRRRAVIQVNPSSTSTTITSQTVSPQSNPAAGSNFTYTNNTGVAQSLLAAQALFTASATVANRFLQWQIQDGSGHIIAYSINGAAVVASTSCTADAYVGNTYLAAATGTWMSALPANITIPPGGVFTFQTTIQAGDTWTNIVLTFAGSGGTPIPGSFVLVGSRRQVQNNSGAKLQPGNNITVEDMQDYYITADGTHPMDILVLNERFDPNGLTEPGIAKNTAT